MTIVIPAEQAHLFADAMSEDQLQAKVRQLVDRLGLIAHHDDDSRRDCWCRGWPDLVIVGNRPPIYYRELKSEQGRSSRAQIAVRDRIIAAGGNYKVWRPMHLISGQIEIELEAIR